MNNKNTTYKGEAAVLKYQEMVEEIAALGESYILTEIEIKNNTFKQEPNLYKRMALLGEITMLEKALKAIKDIEAADKYLLSQTDKS
jgi:hypothetical protein